MTDAPRSTSPDGTKDADAQSAWGFWASLFWVIAAMIVPMIVVGLTLGAWVQASRRLGSDETVLTSPAVLAAINLVPQVIALYFIARIVSTWGLRYLGLQWPRMRYFLLGLLVWLFYIVVVVGSVVAIFGGLQRQFVDLYRSAEDSHALLLLWTCIVLIGPVGEEITFRGFLFRGWSESRLGAWGAIFLTSLAWVAIHLPNNLIHLSMTFGLGLALGWLRWRSGSVAPTILAHVLTNAVFMLTAANAASH
jgi:membrane protease YdiL (CAAX protease family)